jgi:carbohydrate-selective porin OprB
VNSSIRISAAWYAGNDINLKTGTFFKPNTNYLDPQLRLYEFYWSQDFNEGQANLHIGRLGLGPEEFGYTPFLYEFQSAAFSSNPGAFFSNQPATTFSEAVSTWGARLLFSPKHRDFDVRLGIYNAWPRDQGRTDAHGLDWALGLDTAALLAAEYAYKFNQDPEDTGLPGNYKFGILYDTGPFDRFDVTGTTESGNASYYFIFDQMLFSEGRKRVVGPDHPSKWKVGKYKNHPSDQGLYVWGSIVASPDEAINLSPHWLTGGLHYKGPFKNRDADRIGIGYRYGYMSDVLGIEDESSTEIYYHLQPNRWSSLSLNLQYIKNPSGGSYPDAFVPSVGFSVRF